VLDVLIPVCDNAPFDVDRINIRGLPFTRVLGDFSDGIRDKICLEDWVLDPT
jgi:hypothetical protein